MAGGTVSYDRTAHPRRMRLGVVACLAAGLLIAAPAASAQVPSVPSVPPQVTDAIAQAEDLLVPVLIQAADAATPGVNAVGFLLRPECSAGALALVLVVEVGPGLPLDPGPLLTPFFITCGSASIDGPADGVFKQVDGAAGDQLQGVVQPVLDQIVSASKPARPSLDAACGALAVIGTAPNQVPPPLNRFNVTKEICG